MAPSLGSIFVYASFKIHQKKIAQTICVQRKQVFNTCNGRCELQKSIKKYSENERKMQNSLKDKLELVYVQNTITTTINIISVLESKDNSSVLIEEKTIGASNRTFHPPLCIA